MGRLLSALLLAAGLSVVISAPAAAQFTNKFAAFIDGGQAVPPVGSTGTGALCSDLNTQTGMLVGWVATHFDPLSSPVTAITINGPAPAGSTAPVLFTLQVDQYGDALVEIGPLDATQIQQMRDRLWYINVATVNFPLGETRGQVFEVLHHVNPCTLATKESTWGAVKVLYR